MVTTSSSVAALLVVVSSIDYIMAFFHPYSMFATTISSLDSRTLGLCQIASASSPMIRRDHTFTLSYLRTADNDYIQELVKETNDVAATEIETKLMDTINSSMATGYKTKETVVAELEYITQRNVLLAGKIETMKRKATFWRLFQQEEEDVNDHEYNPHFLSTDEEFIDSMANMLLERPARMRTSQTSSPALSVTATSYL